MDFELIPVLLAGLLALAFAGSLVRYILQQDEGSDKVREIAAAIQGGAETLTALTADQLQIRIDAAYRYKLVPDSAVSLYLSVGEPAAVHAFVYNSYRSSVRDAVSEMKCSAETMNRSSRMSPWTILSVSGACVTGFEFQHIIDLIGGSRSISPTICL